MSSSGFGGWVAYMMLLAVFGGLFLLGVWVVSVVWRMGQTTKREARSMRKCRQCWKKYSLVKVVAMLRAMGFGPVGELVDEDYLVLIDGLCPDCWPEYN